MKKPPRILRAQVRGYGTRKYHTIAELPLPKVMTVQAQQAIVIFREQVFASWNGRVEFRWKTIIHD